MEKKEKAISINPQKSLTRYELPRELTSNILRLISPTYIYLNLKFQLQPQTY